MYSVAVYDVDSEYDRKRDDTHVYATIEREFSPVFAPDWESARAAASRLKDSIPYAGRYLQVWAHESKTEVPTFSGYIDGFIASGKTHRLY